MIVTRLFIYFSLLALCFTERLRKPQAYTLTRPTSPKGRLPICEASGVAGGINCSPSGITYARYIKKMYNLNLENFELNGINIYASNSSFL